MSTPYGDLSSVRGLAGILPVYEHGIRLGTGDASETEFELPSVGRHRGYIIDLAGVNSSTITIADIIVYVDGTPVTVSSIDEDKGTVTLASAPANASIVTADYMWSTVSDAQVISAMNIATEQAEQLIRGLNSNGNAFTQYNDGDGVTQDFEFEVYDVNSITSVTVDGSTLTETTHYHLYKYENRPYYRSIIFETPPRKDYKNIVIIVSHGQNADVMVDEMSNLLAARIVILKYVRSSRNAGQFVKGKQSTNIGNVTRLSEINEQIMYMKKFVDKRKRFRLS